MPKFRSRKDLTQQLAESERRVGKLWEALQNYGEHVGDCPVYLHGPGSDAVCDDEYCGLAEAIAATEPKPEGGGE